MRPRRHSFCSFLILHYSCRWIDQYLWIAGCAAISFPNLPERPGLAVVDSAGPLTGPGQTSTPRASFFRTIPSAIWMAAAALLVLAVWAHWPTLMEMARKWRVDPQYSHGYLVPVFSVVLLWLRSSGAQAIDWRFDWRGIAFLTASFLLRCANLATWNVDWLDGVAFVAAVGGIVVLVGGPQAVTWAWPAVGFLMFMIPLPYRVERLLGGQLQGLATEASTFLLQILGLPAVAEGKVIVLNDLRLGVAQACSGLSMLLIFVALAFAFTAVTNRPLLDRTLLVVSSVPIALAVNIVRITATGALYVWAGPRIAELVFHDLAGWLMMPLALGLLWLESRILSYVLVDETVLDPMEMAFGVRPKLTLPPNPLAKSRDAS